MKILIIHTRYKFKGGEDSVVFNEMQMLKSNGLDAELLEFSNEGRLFIKLLQLPFNWFSYRSVRKKIRYFNPDIVHIHNLHFAGSASVLYAIKKSRTPLVITLHNYRLLCPSATLFYRGKLYLNSIRQKFPWDAVKRGVYKNSAFLTFWVSAGMQLHKWLGSWQLPDQYIVLTRHAEKLFLNSDLKIREDQVTVKPNFCLDPRLSIHQGQDYFLYVGRLSEEKGISVLLKAFSESRYTLKIAGDGPLLEEVAACSKRFPNIEFLGLMDKDKICSLLNNCNALIFPSIWYEGMPLTIIEAFACGVPVIASRLGAMETMITDGYNGLFFEPENETDLNEKINNYAKLGEAEKLNYRSNARKTYEDVYTPEKNFEQIFSIYNSLK